MTTMLRHASYHPPSMDDEMIRAGKGKLSSRRSSPTPLLPVQLSAASLSGTLTPYRRSLSRGGSSRGDETPLGSPMPLYQRRSRSVTFVGEERGDSHLREERPYYATVGSESVVKSMRRDDDGDDSGNLSQSGNRALMPESILVSKPTAQTSSEALRSIRTLATSLPTPRKQPATPTRRSASRQRLEMKKHQAIMDHSFYDDSFVEEFISSARADEERAEQEARRQQEEREAQRLAEREAEQRKAMERAVHQARQDVARPPIPIVAPTATVRGPTATLESLLKELKSLDQSKSDSGTSSVSINHTSFPSSNTATAPRDITRELPLQPPAGVQAPAPRTKSDRQRSVVIPMLDRSTSKVAKNRTSRVSTDEKRMSKIEKLIREAVALRRASAKRGGSVMVIDLNDLESDASSAERSCEDVALDGNDLAIVERLGVAAAPTGPVASTVSTSKATRSRSRAQPIPKQTPVMAEAPGVLVQRKRGRTEEPAALIVQTRAGQPAVTQRRGGRRVEDSRPQFDDASSSDGDEEVVDERNGERPVLLQRLSGTRRQAPATATNRIVCEQDDMEEAFQSRNMVPRPPPPPLAGGRRRGAKAAAVRPPPQSTVVNRETSLGRREDAESDDDAAAMLRMPMFTAPRAAPSTSTAPRQTGVKAAVSAPAITRTAPAKAVAAPKDSDPFSHFFDVQFDGPEKFDDVTVSETILANRRTNAAGGGFRLPTSYRGRRK